MKMEIGVYLKGLFELSGAKALIVTRDGEIYVQGVRVGYIRIEQEIRYLSKVSVEDIVSSENDRYDPCAEWDGTILKM